MRLLTSVVLILSLLAGNLRLAFETHYCFVHAVKTKWLGSSADIDCGMQAWYE